jgi:hypothetical protein
LLRRGHTRDGEALEENETSGEGFSPSVEELGELEGEGNVPVTKIDDGGGSGDAPATLELAPGRLRVVNLRRDKLGEPLANQKKKK